MLEINSTIQELIEACRHMPSVWDKLIYDLLYQFPLESIFWKHLNEADSCAIYV